MRPRTANSLLAALCPLLIVQSGCVLPGGLHAVGGQAVEGRLVDGRGQALAKAELILVQGHFDKLDSRTAACLENAVTADDVERAVVWTDSQGQFAHRFKGFTHCHPIWILPPLFTWPSRISGDARHGSFFLVKTPGPEGQTYEIEVGPPEPVVRVFDPRHGRRKQARAERTTEHLEARSELVPHVNSSGHTSRIERVALRIVRK